MCQPARRAAHARTRITPVTVFSHSKVGGRAKKKEGVGGQDALARRTRHLVVMQGARSG